MATSEFTFRASALGCCALGVALRAPELEHWNGADSSGFVCVLGKAWVQPRLLSVDAVAVGAGHFADSHAVRLGSAFDTAVSGGGQVVVPVRVRGRSTLAREDVDGVRLSVVLQVHNWSDVLLPALAPAVVQQDQRRSLKDSANPALVRSELRDCLRVPLVCVAHVELLSFRIPR